MLNAIQNQVLELDMPIANTPQLVHNGRRLIRLSRRFTLANNAPNTTNSSVHMP